MTSSTRPTPPKPPSHARTLRARWRAAMILGLNLLVVFVVGCAGLVLALEQRNAVARLHETAARQTGAAVRDTTADALRVLTLTGVAPGGSPDLETLLLAYPALREISLVDAQGGEVAHVPVDESRTLPDWQADPAWQSATSGTLYTGLAGDPPELVLAAPGADGSVLVARADPQVFWAANVAPTVGRDGALVLAGPDGRVLAAESYQPDDPQRPADFAVFEKALQDTPVLRLYQGVQGDWVVGRAERVPGVPGLDLVVITETPVTEFTAVIVRGLALIGLALVLAAFIGEWLIRRVLRAVVGPIEILQQGARAVMAGDYHYRVRVPPNTDREMVELGSTFNTMIERLADSQRQIDAYTNEVQEIIDQRARELSRKALQLETAAEIAGSFTPILDPRDLSDTVVDLIREKFSVYHVEILQVDDETGRITPGRSRRAPSTLDDLTLHDATHSIIAWVARHGQTLYVPDVTQDERYRPSPDLPASRSELALPLCFEDRVIGVLNLEADHRDAFAKDEIAVLESLANDIAVSVRNAQVFDALETANRDLAQGTLQANQANTLKSRFLLNASLRLREPLEDIIGYSEMIFSGVYGDLPEDVTERQRRILTSGRVLQALIEDMIDLSNIETGEMQLKLEWVTLPPLLEEIMNATRALHQTAYPDHDLTLRLDLMHLTDPLPPVWADIDRLRYILMNLTGNAVKYTDSGDVVMSADFDDDRVRIHVQDTGPGIVDDKLHYLFEPFQQRRRKMPPAGKGTGLGLPVSRLLAMRHGGDLTVDSELYKGSTFTLNLPRHPDGAPPPPA